MPKPTMTAKDWSDLDFKVTRVFTPSAPIDQKDLFSGRIQQIRATLDVIGERGQHGILFGERGVGKTSLANVIKEFFDEPNALIAAPKVNCDASSTFSSVWKEIFSQLSGIRVERRMGFRPGEYFSSVDFAGELPDEITPATVREKLRLLNAAGTSLIIVDEFDRIEDDRTRQMFADCIKSLSDHAIHVTLLLVGVADDVDDLIAEHMSVERALKQIQMPRMSTKEVREVFAKGYEELGLSVSDGANALLVQLTQGLPHYAHLLGKHTSRAAISARSLKINRSLILQSALPAALNDAVRSVAMAYQKAIASSNKDAQFSKVLLGCAISKKDELGFFFPVDMKASMRKIMKRESYGIENFARHLKLFCEEDRGPALEKHGKPKRFRYRFVNSLLQPYVIIKGLSDGMITQDMIETEFSQSVKT